MTEERDGSAAWIKSIPLWGLLLALVAAALAFGRVQSSLNTFTGELGSMRQDVAAIRAVTNAADREVAIMRAEKGQMERDLQRLGDRFELLDVRIRKLETEREARALR